MCVLLIPPPEVGVAGVFRGHPCHVPVEKQDIAAVLITMPGTGHPAALEKTGRGGRIGHVTRPEDIAAPDARITRFLEDSPPVPILIVRQILAGTDGRLNLKHARSGNKFTAVKTAYLSIYLSSLGQSDRNSSPNCPHLTFPNYLVSKHGFLRATSIILPASPRTPTYCRARAARASRSAISNSER